MLTISQLFNGDLEGFRKLLESVTQQTGCTQQSLKEVFGMLPLETQQLAIKYGFNDMKFQQVASENLKLMLN